MDQAAGADPHPYWVTAPAVAATIERRNDCRVVVVVNLETDRALFLERFALCTAIP